ncbi:alpha/beta fold hydrolase [Acrocarpospora catenulata]|uniref:alpha/beta fold hydrolase n=1 Tax=Acrocarpospora catenulata TaxID=2836182 RepID=UPI001BD9CE02|nr:alpha/beta fold hydrolase [Acrocarpospora catenulata]
MRHTFEGPHSGDVTVVDELGTSTGPVLVYLHSEWGAFEEPPLPGELLDGNRVLVVHLPGWGVSTSVRPAAGLPDLALVVWWALDRLDVGEIRLVGHGIGATLAAEMAAAQPGRVGSLALLAPWGMFDEADPGADMFALLPRDLNPLIYADPDGPVATAQQPRPADAHETGLAVIRRVQMLGTASNYLFPIPDTGIAERLYRLAEVPVLLVWGARDGVVPPSLAALWTGYLPHARSEVVQDAAHMVPYESADARKLILEFLA